MKKILPTIRAILFCIILITGSFNANAINITANTNWSTITTGSGPGGQPSATDNITVKNGATLTVDVSNGLCAGITLGAGTAGTLMFSQNSQVTASGTITVGAAATVGNIGFATTGAGGTLICNGLSVVNLGTWTPGTGTVQLNATNTLPASGIISFYNLTINGGTTTLGAAITINNNLTLTSGILDVSNANNYAISILGNWSNNSALNAFKSQSGTVSFSGATQAINGSFGNTFNILVIDVASNTTMSVNNTCAALTFNAATSASSLTQSGTTVLTIGTGGVTLNQPSVVNVTTSWNINAGSASVTPTTNNNGVIAFQGTAANATKVSKIVITTGTLNAYGGISFAGLVPATKVIDMSGGAGILNLQGALTLSASATLTAGSTSIFDYTDNTNQTINFFGAGAYNNLYIDNTGNNGAKLSGAITAVNVTGNISVGSVNSGSLFSTTNKAIALNASKTLTVATGSSMATGSSVVSFGTGGIATINGQLNTTNTSGFSGSATSTISASNNPAISLGGSSTIAYVSATGGQTVTGLASDGATVLAYNNLAFTNTSGTNIANANIVVNGALALTNAGGTFDLGTAYTLSGALTTISNIGTISTEVPTSTSAIPIPSGKTWGGIIDYGSTSGSQTVVAGTYNNLTLSGSAGSNLGGAASVNAILSLTGGILNLGANNLTIGPTGSISGTFSSSFYIKTNGAGQLNQTVGSTQVTFPIGNLYYNPLKITHSGTPGVYGVNVVDGTPPSLWDPTLAVNASWVVSQATPGGNFSLVAQWVSPTQEASNFAAGTSPEIGQWNGTSWSQVAASQTGNTFNSAPNNFTTGGTFAVGKNNCFIGSATTYYSGPSGTLDQLATWWTNTDGTGSHPSDFVVRQQTYVIQNNAILGANWTVSGSGSVVNVGDGATHAPTFTVGDPYVLTVNSGAIINVKAGSTLVLSTTGSIANITPGTLDATSTVNFASTASQTIPALNYGNLTSSSTGARVLASSGTIGIASTFTPGSNTYTISGSTISFNGTGQTIPAFNYYNLKNTNSITLASSGSIGIEAAFTIGGTYKVSGSTVVFDGQSGDADQTVPLITSTDLSGSTAGGYNNLTISSAVTTYMPYTSGSSALGNSIYVFGTLTCSGAGQVVFNNASTAGNVNTFYLGAFTTTSSAGIVNLGSLAGAGTSVLNVYGNLLSAGTIYTASTGNNAIVNFNGTSASPQQFACASARQVWFYINNGAVVNMTGNVIIGSASAPYPSYLIVNNGATLNCGQYIVGSQDVVRIKNAYFILQNGATLGIGSPYGITTNVSAGAVNAGNIQLLADSTATLYRSFNSGANYVYNGTAGQVTGVFSTTPVASTLNNLYIENAAGVTLSQPFTISTALYIGNVGSATANISAVNNSVFYDGGNQISCTGTLNLGNLPYAAVSTITNASTFVVGSTITATSYPAFTTHNIGAGTTVYYNGGSPFTGQVVSNAPNYYNLAISSGTSTTSAAKTLGGNLTVYGALSIAANNTLDVTSSNFSITVGGNWGNAGIFTARNGTVFFNGGATNTQAEQNYQLLNSGGSAFYNLTHNNSYSVSLLANALTTTNNFLNSGGIFDASTGNLSHTVGNSSTGAGSATISGGGYLAGTAQQTFYGGLNISGGSFAGAYSGGYIAAASLVTVGSPVQTSPNVGGVSLSSGTLIAPNGSGSFTVYGKWTQSAGVFTPGSGTVTFTGTTTNGATQTISVGSSGTAVANSSFNSINHTGNGILQIINAPLTTGGTFTNASTAGNFDANGNAHTVGGLASVTGASYYASTAQQTFNGGLRVNGGIFTGNGTGAINSLVSATNVTISSGTLIAPNSGGTFTVSGNWSKTGGSFTPGSGTVNFNGSGTQTLNSGGTPFNNILISGNGTVRLLTNSLSTGGTFTQNSGTFDAVTNSLAHTVTGLATVAGGNYESAGSGVTHTFNGGLTISGGIFTASAGTVTQTGSGNSITVSGGTFTGSTGIVNATNVSITSGTVTAPSATGALNVSGNWANTSGSFTHNSGTVTFNATTTGNTISGGFLTGSNAFNKLVFNGVAGNWTFSNSADAASDFTITNGTVNNGSATISVGGNWANNSSTASFNGAGGTVSFNGSSAQVIGGSAATVFSGLTINNSTGGVTLINGANTNSTNVNGALTLTNGVLTTSSTNLLILTSTASSSVGNSTSTNPSYVNGPMQKQGNSSFTFHIGKLGTGYEPIGISAMSNGSSQNFTAEYIRQNPTQFGSFNYATNTTLNHISSCDYWKLDLGSSSYSNLPIGVTTNITLYWNENNPCNDQRYVTNLSELAIAHFDGTYWSEVAPGAAYTTTGTISSGSITYAGESAFSPFTLASRDVSNPLPIKFDYFNATKASGYNKLAWKAECNSSTSGFEVERSSDGVHFSAIHEEKVNASTDCTVPFVYNDYTSIGSKIYYRIKMMDINGHATYSEIRLILNNANSFELMSIKPNPVQSEAWLAISASQSDKIELSLLSIDGRELQRKTVQVIAGSNIINLSTVSLAKGMYIIRGIFSNGQTNTLPFIKQ